MAEVKLLWDRIEKWAIYGVLLIFFLLELISLFIPAVSSFIDRQGELVLIALILLFIFRYLDERLDTRSKSNLAVIEGFAHGLTLYLENIRECNTVEIFANNGFMYYHALRESKLKIKKLRLILYGVDEPNKLQFPCEDGAKVRYLGQLRTMMEGFDNLQKKGQIEELVIKLCPLASTYHFLIINKKIVQFGLYQPISKYPGTEALNSYLLPNSNPAINELTDDFKLVFETIWGNFSYLPE